MNLTLSEEDVVLAIGMYLAIKGINVEEINKVSGSSMRGSKSTYYDVFGSECEKHFLLSQEEYKVNLKEAYKKGFKDGFKDCLESKKIKE